MKKIKHINSKFYILIAIVIVCLFSSCESIHNLTIEVREPAKITFPQSISQVIIVNNAATPEDNSYGTLALINDQESSFPVTLNYDSILWACAAKTAIALEDEVFFPQLLFYKVPIRTDNSILATKPIPDYVMEQIYEVSGSDAIISIDRCLINYEQKVKTLTSRYDAESIVMAEANHLLKDSEVELSTKTEITLTYSAYIKGNDNALSSFSLRDTLFFNSGVDYDSTMLYNSVPNLMISEAIGYITEKAVPFFIPSWKKVDRYIYTSQDSRMKEAFAFVKADNWTKAENIWSELYQQQSKPVSKARLASNLALAAELRDDFKDAIKWAEEAKSLFQQGDNKKYKTDIESLSSYISSLNTRIKNNMTLSNQLIHF